MGEEVASLRVEVRDLQCQIEKERALQADYATNDSYATNYSCIAERQGEQEEESIHSPNAGTGRELGWASDMNSPRPMQWAMPPAVATEAATPIYSTVFEKSSFGPFSP